MDLRSILSQHLSHTTLKKVQWYLNVPPTHSIDDYFLAAPLRDEVATITAFSKYTRGIAGEDPEAPPDDFEEERRWRRIFAQQQANYGQGMNATTTTTTTTSAIASSANANANANHAASNSNGFASHGNQERSSNKQLQANKKRKTQGSGNANSNAAQAIQFPIIEEGRKVAAKLDDGWMMMTVIKFNKRNRMYTLEDADEQAEEKEEHEVPRDLVVPLMCPEYTPPTFTVGMRVLAVFPGTTSFYPATVQKVVKRPIPAAKQTGKPIYDYMLQFDDDDEGSDGEIIPKKIKGDFVIEDVSGMDSA